jgi:hypothetical protein
MELIRKQTYITPEQDAALKKMAADEGTTEAEVLRRALDAWLDAAEGRTAADPLRRLVGFVDVSTGSVDHDDIYGDASHYPV